MSGMRESGQAGKTGVCLRVWVGVLQWVGPGLLLGLLLTPPLAMAQTGGQGALEGTVTDSSGAVIPKATVTAIDQASNVTTKRATSGAGLYSITPLIPGIYTVEVTAPSFQTLRQTNIEVNGLTVTGLNLKLSAGSTSQTVQVTMAPPQLQTASASVETIITDQTYESLPLIMNNQQRDPTAFATLAPGAQGGDRAPIFAGTGNYLAEVYIDGIPTTTANQQGDNRVVSNGIPVESVEQLQIISSGPSAEYQGAGAIGFTIKSGGNQYHGQVVDLIRNTIFDTWGFAGATQTKSAVVNGVVTQVPAGKNVEHQNELSAAFGGPVPFLRKKVFFFVNYDKFHGRVGVNPSIFTVPTVLMKQGNFSELGPSNLIYNPLTNVCSGSTCTRQAFSGNTIPSTSISPISQYEEKFLPDPNLPGIVNNYIEGGVSGYDNHELVFKVDSILPKQQRLSFVFSHGVRQSVGYGAALPLPYTDGDTSSISPTMMILEHSIVLTPHMVNQFNYGFTRFPQPVLAPTDGVSPYRGGPDVGIAGLPPGQASGNFPGSTFGTTPAFTSAITEWTENGASDASHNVVPNAYTVVDNFEWTKGKHNMTFGIQTQWLEDNTIAQSSPSGIYTQSWSATSTANYIGTSLNTGSVAANNTSGFAYASFLLGAVNSAATSVPLYTTIGGRYHPISPYFQDDWKIRPNLTVNLGLRYDYLPPYHEAQDRFSFFNPNLINPLTGTGGELQYAGNRGAISCQCRTPVHTYYKNWGPRLGMEWAVDPKTVFRAGFAVAYSRAGGVGGRAGDATGTGQGGFGSNIVLPTAVNTGVSAGPSFYLNNSADYTTAGMANANFGGPGYVIPAPIGANAASQLNGIGDYVNSAGKYVTAGGAVSYADPYLSGRAPEFIFYNLGMQKALTQNLTVTLNYSGSESHFVAGAGVPGFWSGQLNPKYLLTVGTHVASDGKTNLLNAPATPANVALAMAADPSITVPYASYVQTQSGSPNSTASIARMLRPYPQYSAPPSPEWDNIANLSYNAFELTLKQRPYKGVSFTLNYTYSHNIGDDGTIRSAFAVPAGASSNGVALPGNDRADRSLVATDIPENLNITGLAQSPFGKNMIGGNNWAVRNLAGGWQLAGIFTYDSGTPLLVVGSGCQSPSQGTCMPDIVSSREHSVRINGGYGGPGVTYANYSQVNYLDNSAYTIPGNLPLPAAALAAGSVPLTKIGDAPRSSSDLRSPSHYNLDAALQRSFNVTPQRVKFIFRADCFDVSNKVTFSLAQTQTAGSTAFGRLTSFGGNRRFQFSGRITF